jgi:hypothetical protein
VHHAVQGPHADAGVDHPRIRLFLAPNVGIGGTFGRLAELPEEE